MEPGFEPRSVWILRLSSSCRANSTVIIQNDFYYIFSSLSHLFSLFPFDAWEASKRGEALGPPQLLCNHTIVSGALSPVSGVSEVP